MVLLVLIPAIGFAQTFVGPKPAPQETEQFRSAEPAPQTPALDSWDGLKVLKPREKIRVVDANFKRVNARFHKVTEDTFTFEANGKAATLPRSDVRMVSIRHSRAGSIGLLILLGALVGATAAMEPDCSCDYYYSCHDYHTTGTDLAIGAGVGATIFGLAAAFSGPSDELIYFYNPRAPYVEAPIEAGLQPEEAGKPESGNVFARVNEDGGGEPRQN